MHLSGILVNVLGSAGEVRNLVSGVLYSVNVVSRSVMSSLVRCVELCLLTVRCSVVWCGAVQCGAMWWCVVCGVVRGRNQQQRVWEVWSPNCNFPPQATTRPRNAVQGRKVVLVVHIATSASSASSACEYFNQCKKHVTSQFTFSCEWIGKNGAITAIKGTTRHVQHFALGQISPWRHTDLLLVGKVIYFCRIFKSEIYVQYLKKY